MLPIPDPTVKYATLAEDTVVTITDFVNASRTRKEQLDRLANVTDDRSGDVEEQLPTALAKKPDEFKYTCQDTHGTVTYLISTERWHPKTQLRISRGAEIWRGVLLPRPAECAVIKQGSPLSATELREKLQSNIISKLP